jgi:hypothetical protein
MGSTQFLPRLAEVVDRRIGWSRLPWPLGAVVLIGLRARLRTLNLYDTGRGTADHPDPSPLEPDTYLARTTGGTCNDLGDRLMGSTGSRFGRNVSPELTRPEDPKRLLSPSPRLVSRRLLTRDEFVPATSLNLLAAAWIQFEVHDWFSHGTADTAWEIPLEPDDPWPTRPMTIDRTAPDPSPDTGQPPTFTTRETHWWDGSQLYGDTAAFDHGLRAGHGGLLRIDDVGLYPADLQGDLDPQGPSANFWVGLGLLHALFLREHNAICVELARNHPELSDQELYDTARLVNTALMAKIHTVDWTPAIIAHPTTQFAMRTNWFGVLGQQFDEQFGQLTRNSLLQGIPGSDTDHHGVPFSLTEEFVAVYRMHPLMPDGLEVRTLRDDAVAAEHPLHELTEPHVRTRLAEAELDDLFYSFGTAHPGALTLHNFPRFLQELTRPGLPNVDLAAADILRTRERGVLRYNDFRRMFRLTPAASFEELTDNAVWAEELRQVYGDVERVDLMVGMYAEPKPRGFGFSDTAFRVFILMASRRLESDRFLTTDFRPEVYTETGMSWVHDNTMRTVLLRHFPALQPCLAGVANPFAPWTRTTPQPSSPITPRPSTQRRYSPPPGAGPTYLPYSDALEQPGPDEDRRIEATVKVLHDNNVWAARKYHHAVRDAHAKGHAVLRGQFTIHPDLPAELRQGLFGSVATYPAIARISTTSGVLRSDQVRGVHGLAIKLLGVEGPRCLPDDDTTTQDLLLVTHREFPFADVKAYFHSGMPTAWVLARLPDKVLNTVITTLAAVAPVTKRFGMELPIAVRVFIEPNTDIVGQTFYSAAPIRWGDYVAKFEIVPVSPSAKARAGRPLPPAAGPEAYRDQLHDFYATQGAEYELRAQLCTDLVRMPIEDATVEWPEAVSPYVAVATLAFPPQDPCDPGRLEYGDEVLSFNSWRGLDAHRPLGPINRLKYRVYEASSDFRHGYNHVPRREPATEGELPT